MSEKCELCGGDKEPRMFGHRAGYSAHDVLDCLIEFRRRIEVLEERDNLRRRVGGQVELSEPVQIGKVPSRIDMPFRVEEEPND